MIQNLWIGQAYRLEKGEVMRGFVVPDHQEHPNAQASLQDEKLTEGQGASSGNGTVEVTDQLHFVIHRPSRNINQVLRVMNGNTELLPTPVRLVELASLQPNARPKVIIDVRILVQREPAPSPRWKIRRGTAWSEPVVCVYTGLSSTGM